VLREVTLAIFADQATADTFLRGSRFFLQKKAKPSLFMLERKVLNLIMLVGAEDLVVLVPRTVEGLLIFV